jgi:hypothetical protein
VWSGIVDKNIQKGQLEISLKYGANGNEKKVMVRTKQYTAKS